MCNLRGRHCKKTKYRGKIFYLLGKLKCLLPGSPLKRSRWRRGHFSLYINVWQPLEDILDRTYRGSCHNLLYPWGELPSWRSHWTDSRWVSAGRRRTLLSEVLRWPRRGSGRRRSGWRWGYGTHEGAPWSWWRLLSCCSHGPLTPSQPAVLQPLNTRNAH